MPRKIELPPELTDEHRQNIDRALRVLSELGPKLDRNEQCGVDCKEYRDMRDYLQAEFMKLRETFWPTVSPKRRK